MEKYVTHMLISKIYISILDDSPELQTGYSAVYLTTWVLKKYLKLNMS